MALVTNNLIVESQMMIKHDKTTISIFPMIIYAIHWGWLNFLVISPSIIDGSQTPIKPVINPAHHQFPSTIQFFNSKIPLIQLIILDSTSTYSHYTLSFSRVAISYSPHQKTHHKTPIFHPPSLGILRKVGRHENQLLRWHLGAHELRILHHLHRDEARHGRAHAVPTHGA